jgi:F0F1-type ATP synthase membrane subunit a
VLFLLIGILMLSLSVSVASPSFATDVLAQLLFSVLILRLIESVAFPKFKAFLQFSMPSEILVLHVLGVFLEMLSIGFRSISLGFRIFANISAGHVLSDIAGGLRYAQISSFAGTFASVFHVFALGIYESFVSTVQIGVFVALVSVYAF